MPTNRKIPRSIANKVAKTKSTDDDYLVSLEEDLESTQDALEEANIELKDLRATNKILSDNSEIKADAVRYAKKFMIWVPLLSILFLVLQFFKKIAVTWGESTYSLEWESNFDGITQASFVIGPLVFVATILGFLLKGVFGQSSEFGVDDISKVIRSVNKPE